MSENKPGGNDGNEIQHGQRSRLEESQRGQHGQAVVITGKDKEPPPPPPDKGN